MNLRLWEGSHSKSRTTIDSDIVKEAVLVERLQEDMELELSELFPKHSGCCEEKNIGQFCSDEKIEISNF